MGTFAEYFRVWARSLVKIPDSIERPRSTARVRRPHRVRRGEEAAHAPRVAGTSRSRSSALREGSGTTRSQIATAFGYEVVGVDIGEERLDFVKSLGAHMAVAPTKPSRWCSGSSAASTPASCSRPRWPGSGSGSSCSAPRGLFVAVGLPATSEGNIEFNPFELFMKDATIIYSAVGTVQDMRELVDLAAAGTGEEPRLARRRAVGPRRRSSTTSRPAGTSAGR